MHRSIKRLRTPEIGAPRPRARRARRPDAARQPVLHLVMPGLEVGRAEPRPKETVAAFLRRTGWAVRDREFGWQFKKGLPTVLEINGEAVLRKDWRSRRIGPADAVRFMSYPLGGGQGGGNAVKQVIGLVALVAVSAFAIWAGPALFGAGTFGALATTAAIGIGGSLLVNALVAPKAGATNTPTATQDQIYSVAAQGNVAKLGQPLPVWYGRVKDYPDFAATPWGEFVANDQYLNVLLSPTMGSMQYEAVYIDDTVFWDATNGIAAAFTNAQIAFYEPGSPVTLFPTNVDQSAEVSGQQLPSGTGTSGGQYDANGLPFGASARSPGAWIGPFAANPAGTLAQSLAVDFVFAAGCYTVNSKNGSIGYSNVGLTAEYATCDNAGAQTGPFNPLFSIVRQYGSQAPVRDSVKVDVAPGRYLVRFRREDAELSGTAGSNSVLWAGLRSFLKGNNSFADVSTIAIRLKASQSTQGAYKFGVLGTRKVPVWNGAAFVTQATRNPAWAFLDAVTSGQYGSGLSIAKVDFNAVVNHAAGCDARGDTFDYRFTTAVAVPDALNKILAPSRAQHFWLGDTVSIVRDEWRDVPTMLLTDREIVRDSMQVSFTMLGEEDPDAVVVEYVDESTWRPAQVQYPPDSDTFTSLNAETKRVDGIVNRDQAFRECAFYYLQSIYRRENVALGSEYEGRAITRGSVIRVQSDLPETYGYGGAVVGVAGATLTLNPAPVWDSGPFYMRLRKPNGKFFGPVLCSRGVDDRHAVLDAAGLAAAETAQATTLAAVVAREDGAEYPSFDLGTGVSQSRLCVVLDGSPNGDQFTLNMVVDDQRVHATDLGNPPVLPSAQYPSNDKVPLVFGLNAYISQGTAEPRLFASWFPTAGAVYYVAGVSYDEGKNWTQVYEAAENQFDTVVSLAAVRLRVQAVNATMRGAYSTVDLEAPTVKLSPGMVTLESFNAALKKQVTEIDDQNNDEINTALQTIAATAANQDARNWLDKKSIKSEMSARVGAAFAQIATVQTVAVNAQQAVADLSTSVTAEFGDVNASITEQSTAIAQLNGYAAAAWSLTLNVNGYVTGIQLVNGGSGVSAFTVLADKFQIQLPGYNGNVPKSVFTVGTIGGVASIGITANMYLDGVLTARMMNIGVLSAITANVGTLTAGVIQSTSGLMVINLTGGTITISDS
ncbi:host specificity factor TipJ family phage tail protein [Bradyrhizobium sp. Pha-3]|uniref:host specificity factor TipJ family phage tail protein n=1 Tax=Bradyrhizobium sp. Pha-3 TaxID=208375 RepID=UPI0035D461A4